MTELRARTQEINAEYWAARESMTERLAIAQLCFALAQTEQAALSPQPEAAGEAGLRAALKANGWEPDTNVCGACFDHGSSHDLDDRCLDCSCQCFSSMTGDEIWTWQMDRLRSALAAPALPE